MSGIVGTAYAGVAAFNAVGNAVGAVGSLLTGGFTAPFGAAGGVVLGDFAFVGFEIPEYISFGGKQKMDVKKLVGGERVVDILGPDDQNITWTGMFMDAPEIQTQMLDQMRSDGLPLPLTWGSYFYTVLIEDFSADTRYSRATYRISCLVLENEANAPTDDSPDLTSSVGDDLGSAISGAAATVTGAVATVTSTVAAVVAPIQATLGAVQQAVGAVGVLIPGSTALAGVAGGLAGVQGALAVTQAGAETALNLAVGGAAVAGNLVNSAAGLTSVVEQAGVLAGTTQIGGFVDRAGVNCGLGPMP